jgi:hypothetical protein
MKKLKKEQQQILMLGTILGIIIIVLVYFYRDKFLPKPSGEGVALPPAAPRLSLPASLDEKIYDRTEYRSLKQFGDVPVRALGNQGSPNPFISEAAPR